MFPPKPNSYKFKSDLDLTQSLEWFMYKYGTYNYGGDISQLLDI